MTLIYLNRSFSFELVICCSKGQVSRYLPTLLIAHQMLNLLITQTGVSTVNAEVR